MKISALSLALFLAGTVVGSPQERIFKFRDGTTLRASVHTMGTWGPTARGLILKVNDAIYFHDYPSAKGSLAPPVSESSANPDGLPSCSPARISFYHFVPETLRELSANMGSMAGTTTPSIQRGINAALKTPVGFLTPSSTSLSMAWQMQVEQEMGAAFKSGKAVWGKQIRARATAGQGMTSPQPTTATTPAIATAGDMAPVAAPANLPVVTPTNTASLQLPARRMIWTTGSGSRNRLDLGYIGSNAFTIQGLFGRPDEVRGEWWGYRQMHITDFPSARRYTVAWFGFQNGILRAVRIGN